jgi:PAS domain S-box-containing protein
MSFSSNRDFLRRRAEHRKLPASRQILLALLALTVATVVSALVDPVASQFSYGLYYIAVVVSALYGGLGAGLLATALAGPLGNFLFVDPLGQLLATPGEWVHMLIFFVVGTLITTLIHLGQRDAQRLRERERFIENLAATAPYTLYLYDVPAEQIDYVTSDSADAGQPSRCAADLQYMHPEDRVRYFNHLSDLTGAPDGTVFAFQYRSRALPGAADGGAEWRWCERQERVYDRTESGAVHHVLGVVQDITARKQAQERVRYQAQLLDTVDQAIIAVDLDHRITFWNRFAEQLYGWTAAEAYGQRISDLVTPPVARSHADEIMANLRQGRSWSGEFLVRRKDGTTFYADVIDAPIYDDDGNVAGILGSSVDIAQRKRAEAYLQFLSDASLALSSSLDYTITIQRVADLAVPRIADWCAVDLLRPGNSVELVAVAHVSPDKVRWAHELRRQHPPTLEEDTGLAKVIRTGESEFYPYVPQELIDQQELDDDELAIIREIGMRSVIIVPMRARGEIIGAMTLVWSESDRHYTAQDLIFAEELANRAAVAVDNARLYEEARIAEQQQAELLAQMEGLIANAPIGITFMDRNLRYVRINEAMADFNGLPVAAHLEHSMDEVLPHLVPLVGPYLHQVLATGEPLLNVEISGRTPNRGDELRHALVSWYPILTEDGAPRFVGTIAVDITERKRFETALRESEERFRATFEQAAVGIAHVGLDGRWLRVNNRLCEIVGYTREELLLLTFQELTHPADLAEDLELVQQTIAGARDGYHLEKRYIHRQGALIWAHLTVSLVRDAKTQAPLYLITVVEDITARKAAETQLLLLAESSRVLFTSLVDERTLQAAADLLVPRLADWCVINLLSEDERTQAAPAPLVTADGDAQTHGDPHARPLRPPTIEPVAIAHRVPAKVALLRELINHFPIDDGTAGGTPQVIRTGRPYFLPAITPDELVGDPRLTLLDQVGLASLIIVPLGARGTTFGSITLARADKRQCYDEGDLRFAAELAQRIALAVDNADLYASARSAELQLRQLNETLEERVRERTAELERSNRELDRFAYVASHDLKAPLRAIDNLSTWLEQDVHDLLPAPSQEHLDKLRGRVQRMERLLDDLLAYSRAGRVQHAPQEVDTGALVRSIFDLQAPPAEFKLLVEEPMPRLFTQQVPLETVLRNLIGNAIKHRSRPDGHVRVRARAQEGLVEFFICDDGPGIAPEYHERIFELFQTLQPRDQLEASGMGLAIVKKTVESAGGQVRIRSAEGEGTCFSFTWPAPVNDLDPGR